MYCQCLNKPFQKDFHCSWVHRCLSLLATHINIYKPGLGSLLPEIPVSRGHSNRHFGLARILIQQLTTEPAAMYYFHVYNTFFFLYEIRSIIYIGKSRVKKLVIVISISYIIIPILKENVINSKRMHLIG